MNEKLLVFFVFFLSILHISQILQVFKRNMFLCDSIKLLINMSAKIPGISLWGIDCNLAFSKYFHLSHKR